MRSQALEISDAGIDGVLVEGSLLAVFDGALQTVGSIAQHRLSTTRNEIAGQSPAITLWYSRICLGIPAARFRCV
jgi:hypothetical protein